MSRKATTRFNILRIIPTGMPGNPDGVNWYERHFWTAVSNCDLEQQGDFLTRAILGTAR